jgi:hypothetical protein
MAVAVVLSHCGPSRRQAGSLPTSAAVTAGLQKNFSNVQSLKGQATLSVETPEQSFSTSARIWFQRPDSLFIKLEAAFGIDVGWLFAAGDRFVLYLPRQNTYYTGSTRSIPLDQFISLDFEYAELLRLIFGEEWPEGKTDPFPHQVDRLWSIHSVKDTLTLEYLYDPARAAIVETIGRGHDGDTVIRKTFSRFTKKKNCQIPQTIRLQMTPAREAVSLFYHTLQINEKLTMKKLGLRIPKNAQHIQWEDR